MQIKIESLCWQNRLIQCLIDREKIKEREIPTEKSFVQSTSSLDSKLTSSLFLGRKKLPSHNWTMRLKVVLKKINKQIVYTVTWPQHHIPGSLSMQNKQMCKILLNFSMYLPSRDGLSIICTATAQSFISYDVIYYLLEVYVMMSFHNN